MSVRFESDAAGPVFMPSFNAARTQAAWRDFAIGILLVFVLLRVSQSAIRLPPAGFVALQALLVVGAVFAHALLNRFGKLSEVTGIVATFGRVSASRLSVASVAALILMFGVWTIAQRLGGAIERPYPWGPFNLDRNGMDVDYSRALWFYFVVTAPIMEELCFRGWIQRGLGRRFSIGVTIFTPAFLFAVLHASVYSHPAYLVIPLALGLTLGLVAERSRSLWPTVVMHSLWNLMMLGIAAWNTVRPPSRPASPDALDVFLALAMIGLASLVLLRLLPSPVEGLESVDPEPVLDAQEAA